MTNTIQLRLNDARERLRAALVAGEDTSPHRSAIAALQRDLAATAQRLQQAETDAESAQQAAVQARAAEIVAAAWQEINAEVARFDLPADLTHFDETEDQR